MKCKFCGHEMDDDAKFCTSCGKSADQPVEESAEEKSEPVIESPAEETSVETAEESPAEEAPVESAEESPAEEAPVESAEESPAEEAPIPQNQLAEAVSEPETEPSEPLSDKFISEPSEPFSEPERIPYEDEADYQSDEPQPVEVLKKSRPSGGRVFACVFLSLFAIAFLTMFNVLLPARLGLCRDATAQSVSEIDAEELLRTKTDGSKTLSDYIYENVDASFIKNVNADQDAVEDFVVQSDLLGFLSEKVSNYSAYLVDGTVNKDPAVSIDELMDWFHSKDDVIEEVFGYEMKQKDYDELEESLTDLDIEKKLSVDSMSDEIGFNLANARFGFSFITIGIILALAIVIYIWIAIILGKHAGSIFGFYGVITLICGIIVLLPSLALLFASSFISGDETIAYLILRIAHPMALFAAVTVAAEVVIAIIFLLIKKLIRRGERKKTGIA